MSVTIVAAIESLALEMSLHTWNGKCKVSGRYVDVTFPPLKSAGLFFQPKEKIFFNDLFPTHFTDDKRAIFLLLCSSYWGHGGREKPMKYHVIYRIDVTRRNWNKYPSACVVCLRLSSGGSLDDKLGSYRCCWWAATRPIVAVLWEMDCRCSRCSSSFQSSKKPIRVEWASKKITDMIY